MGTRVRSLLLLSLLAWVPAVGGREREVAPARSAWSSATPALRARPAARLPSVRRLPRTSPARPVDRRDPPPPAPHGPAALPDETAGLATARGARRRPPTGPSSDRGAYGLLDPYDATAPPAGADRA